MEVKKSPVEIVVKRLLNALNALRKPAAAALLVVLLLMCDPNSALAASGGRMGGSSFSSRTSSSSSSRSYRTSGSGGRSRSSYSAPYSSEMSSSYNSHQLTFSLSGTDLLLVGVLIIVVLISIFLSSSEGSKSGVLTATEKTSVLKLQVGLFGSVRSLQKDLNRIAETANTSTLQGLCYVLTETVAALLHHPDYCISAYSSVDEKWSMVEGEKIFSRLSIEERCKFDEETLVNVNNIKKQSSTILRASGFSNECIVITILVAAEGAYRLPSINNRKDLKQGLRKLASIPSSRILAVEVLWTPQIEDDTLSERELLEDYPLLRPL